MFIFVRAFIGRGLYLLFCSVFVLFFLLFFDRVASCYITNEEVKMDRSPAKRGSEGFWFVRNSADSPVTQKDVRFVVDFFIVVVEGYGCVVAYFNQF